MSNRFELIYDFDTDRWEQTYRQPRSFLPIEDQGKFYEGVASDGFVYEIDSTNRDHADPIQLQFRTPYADFGVPSQTKQITEILIDCDLDGATMTFHADLDNGEGVSQSVQRSNTTRGPVHFPLADDTHARNVALRLDSNNNATRIRFYKITFFYIILPAPLTKLPTDWDNLGYPGDKRLRQLQLEIDTQGVAASVAVQVDGVTTETITVNTARRLIVPTSLVADTIGKLTRLIISGSTGFRYYTHQFEFLKDPLQMTRYDTVELNFNYTRLKFIRRLWVSANTPATVNLEIIIDEVSRFTTTFTLISASGWKEQMLRLPPGLRGMHFRFVFTSSTGFKVFLDQSDVEWHALAGQRSYQRARLAQPVE